MLASTDLRGAPHGNPQATASLVLGVLAVVLAFCNFAPGELSALGIVGILSGAMALIAGARGLRDARRLDGAGREQARRGILAGGAGLLLGLLILALLIVFSGARAGGEADDALSLDEAAKLTRVWQGDGFTLTYPASWRKTDVSQHELCRQTGSPCLFALSHASRDGTTLIGLRFALGRVVDIEESEAEQWAALAAQMTSVALESREVVMLGYTPAVKRVFTYGANDNARYALLVSMTKGANLYLLMADAPDRETFEKHETEINRIIGQVGFAQ